MNLLDKIIGSRPRSVRYTPFYRPKSWLTHAPPYVTYVYYGRPLFRPAFNDILAFGKRATPMLLLQKRIGNVRYPGAKRLIYQPPERHWSSAGDEVVMSDRRVSHAKNVTLPVPKRPPAWKPYDPFSDPDVEWFNLWKKSNEISEKAKRPGPFSRPRWEICLKREMRRMVLHALGLVGKGIHASSGYPHWTKDSLVRC